MKLSLSSQKCNFSLQLEKVKIDHLRVGLILLLLKRCTGTQTTRPYPGIAPGANAGGYI